MKTKFIPYLITLIVVISLAANIGLLCFKEYMGQYFLAVNAITGISLVTILLLSIYGRKKIKGLQSDYIHRIFHKN